MTKNRNRNRNRRQHAGNLRKRLDVLFSRITALAISRGIIFRPDPSSETFGLPPQEKSILVEASTATDIVDFSPLERITGWPFWFIVQSMTSTKAFLGITQEQVDNLQGPEDLALLLFGGEEVSLVQVD